MSDKSGPNVFDQQVQQAITPTCGCPESDWDPPEGPVKSGGVWYLGGRYICRTHFGVKDVSIDRPRR